MLTFRNIKRYLEKNKMNYQLTWYGQIISKVVNTLEEAQKLKDKADANYQQQAEAGWVSEYDPDAIRIETTNKGEIK